MSKKIYILHHLGLGDHFHCNGVVRFLLKEKYNRSLNNFSQPYSESGLAGYADDSSQLGLSGSNWLCSG